LISSPIWGQRPDCCYCQLQVCWYVAHSLLRGLVCHLQLLLALASAVILGSERHGTHTIFYCLRFETPTTWRTRSTYSCPPGIGRPTCTPRHWIPFFSPPITCRATVDAFELVPIIKVKVTLRLVVYRQSVWFGAKPLEAHDQRFFLHLSPCGHSPYLTSSLMTGWVYLLSKGFTPPLSSVHITHRACYWNSSFCSTGFAKQIMPTLCILFYNSILVTWTFISLTTSKFKPFIFSTSGFTLSYAANVFILMILYDFCLLPAKCCYWSYIYIYIYIWKVESSVQIMYLCTLWKISNGAENLILQALQFWGRCLPWKLKLLYDWRFIASQFILVPSPSVSWPEIFFPT
jgi:hypothetical protein